MTTNLTRRVIRAAALLAAFGAILGLLADARSSHTAAQDPKGYPKPPKGEPKWIGATLCKNCHDQDPMMPFKEEYQETRGFEFVRLWENKVWSADDMHSQAYKNLLTADTVTG